MLGGRGRKQRDNDWAGPRSDRRLENSPKFAGKYKDHEHFPRDAKTTGFCHISHSLSSGPLSSVHLRKAPRLALSPFDRLHRSTQNGQGD